MSGSETLDVSGLFPESSFGVADVEEFPPHANAFPTNNPMHNQRRAMMKEYRNLAPIARRLPSRYGAAVKVIMVKKRLGDGSACKKCLEAEEFLRQRGLWDAIHEVVYYDEDEPESPGAVLAREHGMDRAPFFVFERAGQPAQAVDSVMRAYRML